MVVAPAAEAPADAAPVARAVVGLDDKKAKAQLRWEAALLLLELVRTSRLNQKSFLNLDSGLTNS